MSEITQTPAHRLAHMIAQKDVSVVEVVMAFLDRIAATNGQINALVSLRDPDDILREARALDNQPPLGPLHGLPMAPKDLAETKGLTTTYGSALFRDFVPPHDSQMVGRLRAAGAIFVGKSNTPEFGLGSQTYNEVFGRTVNPFDATRTNGGSSGGAAAALAMRMLPVADGSDMMGSLRNPAGWNNVYGFRPSYGMVPVEPKGDVFHKQLSTLGPMAWHPRDLRLGLDVMAAPSPLAPHPAPPQRDMPQRIAWLGDWGGHLAFGDGVLDLCRGALDLFGEFGFEIEERTPRISPEAVFQSWATLRSWMMAAELGPLLDSSDGRDVLKASVIWEIETGRALSGDDIQKASAVRSEWFREMERGDTLWAMPSAQVFPFAATTDWPREIAGRKMDTYHRWMEVMLPSSLIGAPAVCVPAGFRDGLPMGLQIVGPRGVDHALIDLAERYHDARPLSKTHAPSMNLSF